MLCVLTWKSPKDTWEKRTKIPLRTKKNARVCENCGQKHPHFFDCMSAFFCALRIIEEANFIAYYKLENFFMEISCVNILELIDFASAIASNSILAPPFRFQENDCWTLFKIGHLYDCLLFFGTNVWDVIYCSNQLKHFELLAWTNETFCLVWIFCIVLWKCRWKIDENKTKETICFSKNSKMKTYCFYDVN